jgi:anti-sigma B factor antagonist
MLWLIIGIVLLIIAIAGGRDRASDPVRTRDRRAGRVLRGLERSPDRMSPDRPHPLEVVDAELQGAPGVAIRGEIDIAAVPELEHALDVAILESTGAFVLDLSGVEFLDSTGLRLVLRWRALLAREERSLAIVCPPGRSASCSRSPASRICCSSTSRARRLPRRSCRRGAGRRRPTAADPPAGEIVVTHTLHPEQDERLGRDLGARRRAGRRP